jgi:hypothetical protein
LREVRIDLLLETQSAEIAHVNSLPSSGRRRRFLGGQLLIHLALLLFGLPTASATDLVVHSNPNPALALQQVVNTTERTFEQLFPVTMTDLVAQRTPILQGSGQLYLCYSAPTALLATESVLRHVVEAISYGEHDRATELLRTAVATLGCLVEPMSPKLAAQTYFYRGYLELISGRADLARASFRQAKLYEPEFEWDFFFPPDQKAVFDSVAATMEQEPKAYLQVFPPPAVGTLLINGRNVEPGGAAIELAAGIHIVQLVTNRVNSMTVELRPGDQASLVIPSAVPADGVNWVNNEHLRPALAAVFRASVQPDITVFVAGDKSVWEYDVSEGIWTNSVVAAEERRVFMSEQADLARIPKRYGWSSAAVATGLGTVAAVFLGASGSSGKKARDAQAAYDSDLLANEHESAATIYIELSQYQRHGAGLRGAGAASLLLAGSGGAFAVFNFQIAHSRRRALEANNPYALKLAPAAEDPGTAPVKTEE